VEDGRRGAETLAASPAAITLALLLTDEELDSLENSAGDGEIARRGRPGGSDVASPRPRAVGRRGTGARAMLVCCDDPTSVDQAASDAKRNRANAWWTGTLTTRLNDLRTGHLLAILGSWSVVRAHDLGQMLHALQKKTDRQCREEAE
jgi:hypothetical protein